MFRTTPTAESAPVEVPVVDLVPLSHLALDLPVPADGWLIELGRRGINITVDRIGRSSISSDDAKMLIAEHAENEVRRLELARQQEQQAIEADKAFRARLSRGVSWLDMPPGVSPAEALMAAEKNSHKSVREQLLEQELSGTGGLIYHPFNDGEAS